jgi:hypothetical protein
MDDTPNDQVASLPSHAISYVYPKRFNFLDSNQQLQGHRCSTLLSHHTPSYNSPDKKSKQRWGSHTKAATSECRKNNRKSYNS